MQPYLILALVALLFVANGTPVVVNWLLGRRFSFPVDGGLTFVDDRPLFGRAKTVRGIVLAVLATAVAAPLLGFDWQVGAVIGATAMAGDLFSSFVKRRVGLVSSSRMTGVDQIPEALLPVLACSAMLSLTFADIAIVTALFFVGEIALSPLFFRLGLRERPY